jgi:hypothetical protein
MMAKLRMRELGSDSDLASEGLAEGADAPMFASAVTAAARTSSEPFVTKAATLSAADPPSAPNAEIA